MTHNVIQALIAFAWITPVGLVFGWLVAASTSDLAPLSKPTRPSSGLVCAAQVRPGTGSPCPYVWSA